MRQDHRTRGTVGDLNGLGRGARMGKVERVSDDVGGTGPLVDVDGQRLQPPARALIPQPRTAMRHLRGQRTAQRLPPRTVHHRALPLRLPARHHPYSLPPKQPQAHPGTARTHTDHARPDGDSTATPDSPHAHGDLTGPDNRAG
ncbi:hypothetical protein GCM10009679_01840 [Saccharothrix algeriensis]|uniref:Uncharacterized protein n=1 Tax=Catellatospora bangladeshensis TaxID=310355 RepID=A0A8J3JHQ5_9ACTN|nr:hypothetical protein Cba03nite_20410 [Catellatospora bangladeshensis]